MDEGNKIDFVFAHVDKDMRLSFLNHQNFLNDPNVWIADTEATVNNTPHCQGIIAKKNATASDAITVENGKKVGAIAIGDIKGTICDQYGNEI